jgi:DNA-binding transcriptional ArsR family regulator
LSGEIGRAALARIDGRQLASFHLDKLLEEGLLDVEYRRLSERDGPGAGRPSKLYRLSDRQLEISLPGRRYELAARLLAEAFAVDGVDPAEALDQVATASVRTSAPRRDAGWGGGRVTPGSCRRRARCSRTRVSSRWRPLAGLGAAGLEARLEPQPGMCCVAFSMAKGRKAAD